MLQKNAFGQRKSISARFFLENPFLYFFLPKSWIWRTLEHVMNIFSNCHFHNASKECFWPKNFKFYIWVQKCHFGNFSIWPTQMQSFPSDGFKIASAVNIPDGKVISPIPVHSLGIFKIYLKVWRKLGHKVQIRCICDYFGEQ